MVFLFREIYEVAIRRRDTSESGEKFHLSSKLKNELTFFNGKFNLIAHIGAAGVRRGGRMQSNAGFSMA